MFGGNGYNNFCFDIYICMYVCRLQLSNEVIHWKDITSFYRPIS